MATDKTSAFGTLLRQHRRFLRLTQAELAERAGYSMVYISMLERGARTPLPATVTRLAHVLELPAAESLELQRAARQLPATSLLETLSADAASQGEPPLPAGHFLGALPEGPIVGREQELAQMLRALDVVAEGEGRLVLLAGEPGIGKTRLAQEMCVAARRRGFLVTTGRCYEPQRAVAYFPFFEAISHLYAASPPELRAALPHRWPEVGHLLPEQTIPIEAQPVADGVREQQRIHWHATALVQALAEQRPVAILLDDIQWIDTASLELFLHLARHTRATRVLLLGTYRDVDVGRQHPLEAALGDLSREGLALRLGIRRLTARATAALAAAVLKTEGVAAELADLLYQRTDGNPFFTREVVHALVERGDLYLRDGRWECHEPGDIVVPESVRSVIGQRVERLTPSVQEVLSAASVLGPAFRFADLVAMHTHSETEVEAALEEVVLAGLVREAGRDDYTFNHALIQQTLYAELSARQRRRLHRAAGEALERWPEQARRPVELAWHFSEAHELERAFAYALQAGDGAAKVFAHAEAERHYRAALDLAREQGDARRQAEALEPLGKTLHRLGRNDEAMQTLEQAAQCYQAAGDIEGMARALAKRGLLSKKQIPSEEELLRLQSLIQTYGTNGLSGPGLARLLLATAYLLCGADRYDAALAAAQQAGDLAQAAKDGGLVAQAAMPMWHALNHLGRAEEAGQVVAVAIAQADAAGDLGNLSSALNKATFAYLLQGELCEAGQSAERALEAARRLGDPELIAFMLANRGEALFYTGDWSQALVDHEQALELSRQSGLAVDGAFPLSQLGRLHLAMGLSEQAAHAFEEMQALIRRGAHAELGQFAQVTQAERDVLTGHAEVAVTRLTQFIQQSRMGYTVMDSPALQLAWAYVELGDDTQAKRLLEQGSSSITAPLYRMDHEHALRVRALLAMHRAHWQEAQVALEEALSLSRSMGYAYAQAKALYTYGLLHTRTGEDAQARERLGAALAICTRLGERLYAEHIERALAELATRPRIAHRRRVS